MYLFLSLLFGEIISLSLTIKLQKRTFSEDGFSGERFEMGICLPEIYWGMILGTIHVKKKEDSG